MRPVLSVGWTDPAPTTDVTLTPYWFRDETTVELLYGRVAGSCAVSRLKDPDPGMRVLADLN
jgi:hypothetical protein